MSDQDIHRLVTSSPDRSLEGLEAAVWQGVARHHVDRRIGNTAALFQAGVVTLAILIVGAAGASSAMHMRSSSNPLAVGSEHAPSNLLFGPVR